MFYVIIYWNNGSGNRGGRGRVSSPRQRELRSSLSKHRDKSRGSSVKLGGGGGGGGMGSTEQPIGWGGAFETKRGGRGKGRNSGTPYLIGRNGEDLWRCMLFSFLSFQDGDAASATFFESDTLSSWRSFHKRFPYVCETTSISSAGNNSTLSNSSSGMIQSRLVYFKLISVADRE